MWKRLIYGIGHDRDNSSWELVARVARNDRGSVFCSLVLVPVGKLLITWFSRLGQAHTAEPYTSPRWMNLSESHSPGFPPMVYVDFLISACLRLLPYFILRVVVSEFPQCLSVHKQL